MYIYDAVALPPTYSGPVGGWLCGCGGGSMVLVLLQRRVKYG